MNKENKKKYIEDFNNKGYNPDEQAYVLGVFDGFALRKKIAQEPADKAS